MVDDQAWPSVRSQRANKKAFIPPHAASCDGAISRVILIAR